jgi:tetratricopeptide (TPR) repeat protein
MFRCLKYIFTLIILIFIVTCPTGPYIKINESIEELQEALRADTNNAVAYYNLGLGYTANRNYEEALNYFHKTIEREPHFSDAYFAIYCVEFARDKKLYAKAFEEEELEPEIQKKIDKIRSYFEYAILYDPFFDWKLSTLLLERRPITDNPFTQMLIDRIYEGLVQFRLGNYEKAVKEFDYLIEKNPEFRHAYLFRGIAQAQIQNYKEAIENFQFLIDKLEEYNKEKVLPVYLNPAELYYLIAFAYLRDGNLDEAEKTFKKVITENMGFYMAHYQISNICKMRGDYAGALKEINAAIIGNPNNAIFHFSKGVCLNTMRRDWEAIQEYKKAISLNPNYPKSYYTLAVVSESIGNKENAVKNYRSFIDKAPKSLIEFVEKAQLRTEELEKEKTLQKN